MDTDWEPLDFTQGHSFAGNDPAAQPQVGDYLTVPDTVPKPAPGEGVYYVASATHQGAISYGRKTTARHLSVVRLMSRPDLWSRGELHRWRMYVSY